MASEKGMVSMMHEERIFAPSKQVSDRAHIKSMDEYRALYQESLDDPEGFWGRWMILPMRGMSGSWVVSSM